MYIIFTSLRILPDKEEYEEMKASLHIMMGNILSDFFEYNSILLRTGLEEKKEAEVKMLEDFINMEELVFDDNIVTFPKNKVYRDVNDIKTLFKMAMTQYKKAMAIFVLDGFVTEHVNIVRQMSKLYLTLSRIEEKKSRIYAMNVRRAELVKPLHKEISPKHYVNLWRVSSPLIVGTLHRVRPNPQRALRDEEAGDLLQQGFRPETEEKEQEGAEEDQRDERARQHGHQALH